MRLVDGELGGRRAASQLRAAWQLKDAKGSEPAVSALDRDGGIVPPGWQQEQVCRAARLGPLCASCCRSKRPTCLPLSQLQVLLNMSWATVNLISKAMLALGWPL